MWQFTLILKTWASLNYPNEMLGKQHLLCFYARKRANIWCQYIANLRGVWCDTFISICKQSKHQSTSDAGRAGLQTDTSRYKTLISAQRFSRRIQEGATQRNDGWEKELMQKLWISAPSFLLPRGQSNNWRSLLLLQYVDWIHLVYPAQASQGTSWDIITGVYVMVPCCPMSLWTILTPKPAGTFVIFSVFGCESSPTSCNVR